MKRSHTAAFTAAICTMSLLYGVAQEASTTAMEKDAGSGTDFAMVLSDFDAAPDGVSILAAEGDAFKMLSIATAPYKSATPAALSAARTVAVTKAQGALSRFLNENLSVEDYLEKEVSKVRIVSDGGAESAAQIVARRVLTRIRSQSKSLLSGVVVLQTERIPAEEGSGGSFRVVVGVSSTTLDSAKALEAGIDMATP